MPNNYFIEMKVLSNDFFKKYYIGENGQVTHFFSSERNIKGFKSKKSAKLYIIKHPIKFLFGLRVKKNYFLWWFRLLFV